MDREIKLGIIVSILVNLKIQALARITWTPKDEHIDVDSTYTDDELRGQGIAGASDGCGGYLCPRE